MKFIRTFVIPQIILLFTTVVWSQTADDIINRYLDVTGRKTGLQGVNTLLIKRSSYNTDRGTMNYLAGYSMRPNKFRFERGSAEGERSIMSFDGKKAWREKLDTATNTITNVKDIPEDSPLFQILFKGVDFDKNFDGKFMDYSKKGSLAELIGKEMIDGRETYHIKMDWVDGSTEHYYFDKGTGLIWKYWNKDNEGRTHTSLYSDYQRAGRILVPYTKVNTGPIGDNPEAAIEEKVLEIEMNIVFNDSLFSKPSIKK